MRIALVNEYFAPHSSGGAEESTEALARALGERGHGVVVMTPRWGWAAPLSEERDGFRIRRFRAFVRSRPAGPPTKVQRWLRNPLFYRYAGRRLASLARVEGVDVLHVQNKHMLMPALFARERTGLPVVLTVRDTSLIDPAPVCLHRHDGRPADCGLPKLWRECAREYHATYARGHSLLRTRLTFWWGWHDATYTRQPRLAELDAVIGVSDGILGVYRRSGLLTNIRRVETIYTIPPLAVPSSAAAGLAARERHRLSGPVVLFVGRLSTGKGAADLFAAAERVHARHPQTLFLIVGDRGNVPAPPVPWIRLTGRLPNADVLALYAAADVVVVPSVIPDAFSRVILEAMAAGRPVVGTDVGGTPELIVHDETGLLVPRHDPTALAAALGRLLDDPALTARLGAAARRRVETRFSAEASIERLVALYAAVRAA